MTIMDVESLTRIKEDWSIVETMIVEYRSGKEVVLPDDESSWLRLRFITRLQTGVNKKDVNGAIDVSIPIVFPPKPLD